MKKVLHLKLAIYLYDKIYLMNQKHDILQELYYSNMDYSHLRHQRGAVFLTCMSFNTRLIMIVGGGGWMAGERG